MICDDDNTCTGVVFGYKGVLLLFGMLLVYETRSIKLYQINDSRFISMSMCNIVVSGYITSLSHLHSHTFITPPGAGGVRSIVMSISVCGCVCLSVCLSISISQEPYAQNSPSC